MVWDVLFKLKLSFGYLHTNSKVSVLNATGEISQKLGGDELLYTR